MGKTPARSYHLPLIPLLFLSTLFFIFLVVYDLSRETKPVSAVAGELNIVSNVSSTTNFPGGVWQSNGNVGIGKTNPTVKLDVTGDLNISGNTNICTLVSYTGGSGTTSCPSGYYTYSGVGLTDGELLCCKVSNPI